MFDDRFEVFLADTDFGISINKQIRYRVFCLERGFEDPTAFPNGEESDIWDQHSTHFIVREKSTGRWVASTRIVFPDIDLPVERLDALSEGLFEGIDSDKIGEISRFCIVGTDQKTASLFSNVSHPQFDWIGSVAPNDRYEIILGMLRAISTYGLHTGIDFSFMLITKPFARLLKRVGIIMYQVGKQTDYRGARIPYLFDLKESLQAVTQQSDQLLEFSADHNRAYRFIGDLEKECTERLQQQLDSCAECRMN